MGIKVFDDPVDGKGVTWADVLKPSRGWGPNAHPDMHARVCMVAVSNRIGLRDDPFYAESAKRGEELTGDPMNYWTRLAVSQVNIALPSDILQTARALNIDSVNQILARYPDE